MSTEHFAYALLAAIHLPVAVLLLTLAFRRQWVSQSPLLHLSFLAYWGMGAIRLSVFAFGNAGSHEWLVLVQAIGALPLCAYIVPAYRRAVRFPCITAYNDAATEAKSVRDDAEKKLQAEKDSNAGKLRSLNRLVRRLLRDANSLKSRMSEREEMQGMRDDASRLIDSLEATRLQIVADGGGTGSDDDTETATPEQRAST